MAVKQGENHGAVEVGALKPQPHGGALRHGGTGKGGTGRPKNELREVLRKHATKRLPMFWKKFEQLTDDQQLRALDMAFRYGLGTQMEVMSKDAIEAEQRALIDTFSAALRAELSEDVAGRVVAKFREMWEGR